jgi:hypothetical protein
MRKRVKGRRDEGFRAQRPLPTEEWLRNPASLTATVCNSRHCTQRAVSPGPKLYLGLALLQTCKRAQMICSG